MLGERISVAIRRRLPFKRSPEVDPRIHAANLIAQLPSEDNLTSSRLMASIRRDALDADLGWKAKDAWVALEEARKAQVREPNHDYAELIGQAQLQHGYAFARELESDAKKAKYIRYAKNTAWALTIVGPIFDGMAIVFDEVQKQMRETDAVNRAFREAQIQDQIRANNDPKNRAYWELQAGYKNTDSSDNSQV